MAAVTSNPMVDTTGFESEGQKGPPYPDEFGDPASTGKIGKVKERVRAIKELKKFVDMAVFGSTAEADEYAFMMNEELKEAWGGLLHPDTNISSSYDLTQMLLLLYLLFTLPYNLAFGLQPSPEEVAFWIDLLVDISLTFDIFLNMFRFYHHPRTGELVTDPKIIRSKYLRGWFFVDTVAIFPFDYIVTVFLELQNDCAGREAECTTARNEARSVRLLRMTKLTRFVRLSKLLKLGLLHKLNGAIMQFVKNLGVTKLGLEFTMRVTGLLILLIACMHLCGCIWLHMGLEEYEAAQAESNHSYLDLAQFAPGKEYNWMIKLYGSAPPDNLNQYIDAAYWVMVTLSSVGYGDVLPSSSTERFFTTVLIVFGTFLYAYIVGSFTNMLSNMGADKSAFDTKMRSVQELCKFLNVPDELEQRVQNFYEYRYMNKTMFSEELSQELPSRLRADLVLHKYSAIIEKVPFFHGIREDAVVDICAKMKSTSIMPEDLIIQRGEPYRELVIMNSGKARSVVEPTPDTEIVGSTKVVAAADVCIEYQEGSFFGELEFLGFSEVRCVTVQALRFTEISTLNPNDIESVLDVHIGLRRRLTRYGKLKMELDEMMADDNDEEIDDAKLEEMKQRIEDQFDDTETSELKGIFDDCDIDGTGRMDLKEFTRSLASLKLGLAPEGVEEIFDGILKEKQRQANSPNSTSFEITFDDFQNFWHKHGNTIKAKNHERSIHDMIGDTNARVANLERQVKTIGADVSAIKEMIAKLVARH